MPFRLSARCSILLNLRNLLWLFLAICFPRKRTARLSPAVQVREETPREGQRRRGWVAIAYPILQVERSRALTMLNFLLTFRVLSGDRSYCCRSRRRETDTLFQKECSGNLIASATKRSRVSASTSPSRAVILRSNTIDVPLATSAQLNVRARNDVTFRFPCFRPKIAESAAVRGR